MLRRGLSCLLLLLLLVLNGCWSRIEINDFGAVVGMAVDKGDRAPVRLTLYVARSFGSAKGGTPQWVVAREGKTIPDALRIISRAASRRISLQHVRVILVGEAYARAGLSELTDFVARHAQIRLTARPVVVQGTAQPVLTVPPELEALQPENLVKIFEARGGLDPKIKDILIAVTSETHTSWTYAVSVITKPVAHPGAPHKAVAITGVALYLKDKLVDILPTDERQAVAWLLQNPRQAEFSSPCPDDPGKSLSVRVENGQSKIVPTVVNNKISFTVTAEARVHLLQLECPTLGVVDPGDRKKLELAVQAELTKRVQETVRRLQQVRADPAGFGKRLQLRYPSVWRQTAKNWPQVWSQTLVRSSAKVTIHHSGMIVEPANQSREELQGRQP